VSNCLDIPALVITKEDISAPGNTATLDGKDDTKWRGGRLVPVQ